MARQFEVHNTGWRHGNLIVGWDPAIGTYYAQILDGTVDESGPLLWLTPRGTVIQDLDKFEKYINEEVKNKWNDKEKWPPIKLNKPLRASLERNQLAEGGYWNKITAEQYQTLLSRVTELEEALNNISSATRLIGHNRPPDSISLPYTEDDEQYIRSIIATIKTSSHKTLRLTKEITSKLLKLSKVILLYAAKQADISVTKANENFSATMGKYAAHAVIGTTALHTLGLKLENVAVFIKSLLK